MEDIKEYIYILDYSDSTISEIPINPEDNRETEDILKEYGFNINTCSFMIVDHRIEDIVRIE